MIAFAHYSAQGDVGGVTTWLGRLIRALQAEGLPVALLLHHVGTSPQDSEFRREMIAAGVIVESEVRPFHTEDGVRSTLAFLARHRPRLFLPQCLNEFFFAATIAGDQGLPWAMVLHSDEAGYWAPLEQTHPGHHGGLVVPVSHHIAVVAEQRGHSCRDRVIPYGVAVPESRVAWSAERFRVVFSGRVIEEQKRISLVIEAMVRACQLNPRIECRVVGGGDNLEKCREAVRAKGLADRFTFSGRLEPDRVGEELELAHAILFMSDYEGLPVALLEAMARGVVPVARMISSGIPEVVREGETGLLVDASPETAASALARLAADATLWDRCSMRAKQMVAGAYSESRCHARWLEVIREHALPAGSEVAVRVPYWLRLPPVHPDFVKRDIRLPSLWARAGWKVKGAARRAKRLLLGTS